MSNVSEIVDAGGIYTDELMFKHPYLLFEFNWELLSLQIAFTIESLLVKIK